jgi:hypothetical protein
MSAERHGDVMLKKKEGEKGWSSKAIVGGIP